MPKTLLLILSSIFWLFGTLLSALILTCLVVHRATLATTEHLPTISLILCLTFAWGLANAIQIFLIVCAANRSGFDTAAAAF
ncbi:hypothetical protein HDU98_010142, partial [Podochytrium sp. JEL0797]